MYRVYSAGDAESSGFVFDLCRGIDSQDTILRNICPYSYKKHTGNNSANSSGFYIGSTLQKTR